MAVDRVPVDVDVLVVGAGLSGIGAACLLRRHCPDRTFLVLEGRAASGGTWDLFRYPGVRSDSDMYTLGYGFQPYPGAESIARGEDILAYLRETARAHDVERTIRYRHRVVRAAWSSEAARWTVDVDTPDGPLVVHCGFLHLCAGYYDTERGHAPAFAGQDAFTGTVVHPQAWPDDLAVAGRRIAVIGSGATAMTLVPALAQRGADVTLVQRSPTWVVALPSTDGLAVFLRRLLPARAAHAVTRWKQVRLGRLTFRLARWRPRWLAGLLLRGVRAGMGPGREAEVAAHFTPRYDPWRQRLCVLPDGDLFRAVRAGRAHMVTGEIERFVPAGLRLRDGREVVADVIVTATGLCLRMFGGIDLVVDGAPVDPATSVSYKGVMFSGVPNFAAVFGYTNASWTLKADLANLFVCRVLNEQRRRGARACVATMPDTLRTDEPWIDFSSGYFQRAIDRMPRQGARAPWRLEQDYLRDVSVLRDGPVDDGVLTFSS